MTSLYTLAEDFVRQTEEDLLALYERACAIDHTRRLALVAEIAEACEVGGGHVTGESITRLRAEAATKSRRPTKGSLTQAANELGAF
jgi:hypothetical protein